MPRRPNLDRPVPLEIALPESVRVKLDLQLFSELEGRVPLGAYKEFFIARLREWFEWERFEIAPGEVITGPREAIEKVRRMEAELNNHYTSVDSVGVDT